MKRQAAIDKLHRVCNRLDTVDPADFFVIPQRLYLFGSLLTNKLNPTDVDLQLEYRERSDLDPDKILYAITYGKPLPHNKAFTYLRKGMQMIHFETLTAGDSVDLWLEAHRFEPDAPIKLIWEKGLDWQTLLREVERHPIAWNPATELRTKDFKDTAKRIKAQEGQPGVEQWMGRINKSKL